MSGARWEERRVAVPVDLWRSEFVPTHISATGVCWIVWSCGVEKMEAGEFKGVVEEEK